MAIEQVPYTNFHDLNLDWVLKVTKEAADIIETNQGTVTDIVNDAKEAAEAAEASAQEAYTAAQGAANALVTSQMNASRAETASTAAQEAYNNTLVAIDDFASSVQGATSEWLEDNINPETGYALDSSLTVQGAAADAKAVGDRLTVIDSNIAELDTAVNIARIELSAVTANIADVYDATETYTTGDYCMYDNLLRVCIASTTTGTFDATAWETVTVISQVGGGGGGGATDAYTKAQTNALLAQKVDNTYLADNYYNKQGVNDLLSGKVNNTALDNYYTSAQTDALLSNKVNTGTLTNYYNKTETDSLLSVKADTSALGDYYTKEEINTIFSGAVNPYPVGSIYMSVNSTSPATLFGGTWARIQDTFLLAAGTIYTAGATGGEATHTLTIDEMPSHSHTISRGDALGNTAWSVMHANTYGSDLNRMGYTGGGQAHNNMPPYLAVYVWQRTA